MEQKNNIKICIVCKQPIDPYIELNTKLGPTHPGDCYNFVLNKQNGSLNEKELSIDDLQDVQLLID